MGKYHLIPIMALLMFAGVGCGARNVPNVPAAPAAGQPSVQVPVAAAPAAATPAADGDEPTVGTSASSPAASGDGGTLMWADGLASVKARSWKSDAVLCGAGMYISVSSEPDDIDDGVLGLDEAPSGSTLYYASPSAPDKVYAIDVYPRDGEYVLQDTGSFKGEIQKLYVADCAATFSGWTLDSDDAMVQAIKFKEDGDFIAHIAVGSGAGVMNCAQAGTLGTDYPIVRVQISGRLGSWGGDKRDRIAYFDGRTGEHLGTVHVFPPGKCEK